MPGEDRPDRRPLLGRRVLVTRAREQARALADALVELGAEPLVVPTISVEDPHDPVPLREAARAAHEYDWLVFTSANAVRRFFEAFATEGGDVQRLRAVRVLAIGSATARALRDVGVAPDIVPDEHRGEAAARALVDAGSLQGKRVLLPRAAAARDVVPDRLRAAGAIVDAVTAYRTVLPPEADRETVRSLVEEGRVDAALFTSPSTLRNFVEMFPPGIGVRLLARVVVATIGPVTSEAASQLGVEVHVEASPYTVDGLVRSLAAHYGGPDVIPD